eukprot:COSAG05_NODE_133_length_17087_cov_268.363374_5_plen_137_part_00
MVGEFQNQNIYIKSRFCWIQTFLLYNATDLDCTSTQKSLGEVYYSSGIAKVYPREDPRGEAGVTKQFSKYSELVAEPPLVTFGRLACSAELVWRLLAAFVDVTHSSYMAGNIAICRADRDRTNGSSTQSDSDSESD